MTQAGIPPASHRVGTRGHALGSPRLYDLGVDVATGYDQNGIYIRDSSGWDNHYLTLVAAVRRGRL